MEGWGALRCAIPGSTVVHVMHQFLGAFERAHIFYVKMEPRILESISSCLVWRSVHGRCSVTWKSGHYLRESLASGRQLFAVRALPEKSFLRRPWLAAVSCRVLGV